MKTLITILSLSLAFPALAGEVCVDAGTTVTTTTTVVTPCKREEPTCVCKPEEKPAPKPKRKKKPKTKAVVKAPEPVKPTPAPKVAELRDSDPDAIIGLRLAYGLGIRDPHDSGLVGLRLHFARIHLGLEGYWLLDKGAGGQVLVYPYQGKKLNVHVNAGLLGTRNLLSVQDVPRTWDVTVGSGLEYRLFEHVALTLDWRTAIPSPVFVADHDDPIYTTAGQQVYGSNGRYLDVPAVLGNSFTQSHVLFGIMFRN